MPKQTAVSVTATAKMDSVEYQSELQKAIIKGLKEQANLITKELLLTEKPLDIVQNEIIPALNIVGVGFENKKYIFRNCL